MHLNHLETMPLFLIHGKVVFQQTGPWCQKGWGPLPQIASEFAPPGLVTDL